MKFWKTHRFKKLMQKWEARLSREGLGEIESCGSIKNAHADRLTRSSSSRRGKGFKSQETREAIQDYYIWAEQCLTLCRFQRADDRTMWRMHAEGRSAREIARHFGRHHSTVDERLRAIRAYLRMQTEKVKIPAKCA